MGAALPSHVIGEDMAARKSALRRIGLIAEGHSGAFHHDVWPAESQATGALGRAGRRVVIAPEGVGVAEFVDQGRTKRADQRDRSEEHTSELQSLRHLVCRLLL